MVAHHHVPDGAGPAAGAIRARGRCSGYLFSQSVGVAAWSVRTWRFLPSAASTT